MKKVAGLPKSVKVGPYDVKIVERDEEWSDAVHAVGMFFGDKLQIEINVYRDAMFVLDTLLHEIFHAIFNVYDLADDDREEKIVTVGATAFTQVFRDNPALTRFMQQVLTKTRGK